MSVVPASREGEDKNIFLLKKYGYMTLSADNSNSNEWEKRHYTEICFLMR